MCSKKVLHDDAMKLTVRDLKHYCRKAFENLIQDLSVSRKVHLIPIRIPFSSKNGLVISLGRARVKRDLVVVNLRPYLRNGKDSPAMSKFYLHSVVAHELKHIKLLQDWYEGVCCEREVLFSEWTLDHACNRFHPDRLIQTYLSYKGASELRKKRYNVSPIELLCYQFGFQEAYRHCTDSFSESERKIADTIIESISFINRYIEIDYFSSRQAYNRFTHTLHSLQLSFRRHPEIVAKYPLLQHIFTTGGLIKSPEQIFAERGTQNAEIVDYILIRMFITLTFDWKSIFAQNREQYEHIGCLANCYCADAIDYLKRQSLGEVFLSKDILQDNAAMLIKNVNRLNQLMDKYGIQHTTGSLLPLYYSDDFTKAGQ